MTRLTRFIRSRHHVAQSNIFMLQRPTPAGTNCPPGYNISFWIAVSTPYGGVTGIIIYQHILYTMLSNFPCGCVQLIYTYSIYVKRISSITDNFRNKDNIPRNSDWLASKVIHYSILDARLFHIVKEAYYSLEEFKRLFVVSESW